jgi:hypothetical protein
VQLIIEMQRNPGCSCLGSDYRPQAHLRGPFGESGKAPERPEVDLRQTTEARQAHTLVGPLFILCSRPTECR